jgi:hypothetical protein
MRTLNGALTTAYGAAVQKPAWLVELTLTQTYRYCSHAQVTWNSQTWLQMDVDVSGLQVGAMSVTGSLVFGNADDAFGALALNEGFVDKRIRIWGYDASIASPTVDTPVLLCDAVGGAVDIGADRVRVALRDSTEYLIAPRAIVAPEFGFTKLLQSGSTLTINGITFTIQRGR